MSACKDESCGGFALFIVMRRHDKNLHREYKYMWVCTSCGRARETWSHQSDF